MSRENSAHVYVTRDEDTSVVSNANAWLAAILDRMNIDVYNEQFVLRLTIDKLDPEDPQDYRQREEDGDANDS